MQHDETRSFFALHIICNTKQEDDLPPPDFAAHTMTGNIARALTARHLPYGVALKPELTLRTVPQSTCGALDSHEAPRA